ncbi:hypothetical protein BHF71_06090 [Vulcanibacillus modesticaldus]|uniref:Sugar fermentation stimulation protein homolog n=1 Tax=Vulcanibacillus modesticaldus TaxID=337097 RepID=A0A1D2YX33_9BACI|nr:hypothetical protein BHF71_06090 [Vulcanibacillus modesticaldus]
MDFPPLTKATFIKRVNRFIAEVKIKEQIELVHVPSTGRLDGILKTGVTCYLKPSSNPKRKTAYSLFLVEDNNVKICIDSLITNDFVYQLLRKNEIPGISIGEIAKEVSLPDERIDFVVRNEDLENYIEVKSVNKCDNGVACFPDAPTERGRKHLTNLIKYQSVNSIQSHLIFVIQRNDAEIFSPCKDRDPEFANLLKEAYKKGVKLHICLTNVTENEMYFDKWLKIKL